MSTYPLYTVPAAAGTWDIATDSAARFGWEYQDGNQRLLDLYQKGKDKQWDQVHRIDWHTEVDQDNPTGTPDELLPIYGSKQFAKLGPADVSELRRHLHSWQFSQFLHGEQGAMICSARIVESVPGVDAKFYAATQTMDEARHAETYSRYLHEKIGMLYPINPYLGSLLEQTLSDSRWDMPYLGMQVLIEGLALAAFGLIRDVATAPLPKQIVTYVMQDEARHVAFGRIALKEYYSGLTRAELDEREQFVVEGCYLMRDRFRQEEVWANLGYDMDECLAFVDNSENGKMFRQLLFTRIVPCVKDIGLWGPRVQKAFADMGVLDMAGVDLDGVMSADEAVAENLDRERADLQLRQRQVEEVIDLGVSV